MTQPASKHGPAIIKTLTAWKIHAGWWLKVAVAIGLISGVLLIGQAWLLAATVHAVVFEHATLTDLSAWLWALMGIFVLRAGLVWAAEQAAFQAAARVKSAVRLLLYQKLQRLDGAWLTEARSGGVATTLSDGVEALEAYYARYLPAMALMVWVPLALVGMVFVEDWVSGVIMLVTAPLIPLFMILIGKGTEKRNQKQWRQLARMSAHFLDVIQGLTTLKLFTVSRREAQVVASIADEYRHSTMSVLRVAFLSSFMLEFLASVSIAVVAVLIGFRLFWGEMPFFNGFLVLLLAPEFYLPLRQMGGHYHSRMQAIGAAEQMIELLNAPEAVIAINNVMVPLDFSQPLQLEQVRFVYPDGRVGLEQVTLTLPPKQTIAIVGTSGAGKSTLMQILLGFLQPQSGTVRLGSIDLAMLPRAQWQAHVSWLAQTPYLFPLSIAENIRLGRPSASLDEIIQAAKQAGADAFIRALPQGYDTLIGDGGQGVSGGQRQRIALARVFLKAAPLVLLDEATAHLDVETEQVVQQALQALNRHCTLVLIAHRLTTIQHADCVVVLDAGGVAHVGTLESLKSHSVLYQRMLEALDAK